MCFECRVLGALLVPPGAQGAEVCSGFRALDFCPTVLEIEDKQLRDYAAEEYLHETLAALAENFGVELVPIKVDSDGSCLPHAVSRCLVGKEILYDALRSALESELREHADFYRSILNQGMDEDTFAAYWASICDEAQPTHGAPTGRWLGPEHILGLANVLRRPILLLDTPDEMLKADHRCGLFLPLRHNRESSGAVNPNGEVASPVVIGWASEAKNHFVSLVVPSRSAILATEDNELADRVVRATTELWETVEQMMQAKEQADGETTQISIPEGKKAGDVCMLRDSSSGEEYAVQIPPGKGPGDSFPWTVPGRTTKMLIKLKRALVHFYALTPPVLRKASCATLFKVLSNLVDALLLGDTTRVEKVSRLPLDNATVRNNILRAPSATEVLKAVEFEIWDEPKTARRFLRFQGDLARADVCDGLVLARDLIGLMRLSDGVVVGGGQVPFARQRDAFGPQPAFVEDWDRAAEFAQLAKEEVWVFGRGNFARLEQVKSVTELMSKLKAQYARISAGTEFGDMPWDDLTRYNHRLKRIKCHRCGREQEWHKPIDGLAGEMHTCACEDCNENLLVDQTGQRRMAAFVADALGSGRLTWCSAHDELHEKARVCPACPEAAAAAEKA